MEIVTTIFACIGALSVTALITAAIKTLPDKIKDKKERHIRWIVDNEIRILADNGWIKKLVEENKDGDGE